MDGAVALNVLQGLPHVDFTEELRGCGCLSLVVAITEHGSELCVWGKLPADNKSRKLSNNAEYHEEVSYCYQYKNKNNTN